MKLGLFRRLRVAFRRVLRRAAEKVLGRTYDGASPPPRLVDEVRAFSEIHPRATRGDWEDFALAFAAGAYRDGFSYGVEWRERWTDRVPFDEALLSREEKRARLWTAPGITARGDPLLDVPPEHREEVLRELEFGAGYGGFTFRFVDDEGRPIFSPAAVPAPEEQDDGGEEEVAGGAEAGDDTP